MEEQTEFPPIGETVIVKITKVLDYGAFAELPEYDNVKGFIHISQISPGWIKNIRNFVKEGHIRAAKVQSVDREKKQIDLSLTKVSESAQRAKINQFKQMKRERKLIETLAKRQKKSFDETWDEVAEPLIAKYGSLVTGFQRIAIEGKAAAADIPAKWVSPLIEMIEKSIVVPERTVKGMLKISVIKPNGVEIIRRAFSKGIPKQKEAGLAVSYIGSGKYLVRASSYDFKLADKAMSNAANSVVEFIKSNGGTASFEKVEEK